MRRPILVLGALVSVVVLLSVVRAPAERTPPPTTLRALYGAKPIATFDASKTALVLVDFQEELLRGRVRVEGGDAALAKARQLLDWARRTGVHVVHVRNVVPREDSPLFAPGSPLLAFARAVEPAPGEAVVTKPMAGGFSRSELDAVLRARGVDTLVVGGVMTHLAVDTTAREGTVLGYRVVVAADACATRPLPSATDDGVIDAATVHRVALASLADRFAEIASTSAIVARPVRR